MTTFYALVEPELGETRAEPGGIVRHRVEDDGSHVEVLVAGGEWEDRYPELGHLVWEPEAGAERLDPVEAEALIAGWPGPRARAGLGVTSES